MEIVENNFTIKIEGKAYHIYESYIKNGTGYTFRIYVTAKHRKERENCFWYTGSKEIVVIGKEYNYMLIIKKDCFEYDIVKYDKTILRLEKEDNILSIYLNFDRFYAFYDSKDDYNTSLWNYDIEYRKKIIRKQKLKKIENDKL